MTETAVVEVVPAEVSGDVTNLQAWARSLVVTSHADRVTAIDALKRVKGRRAEIVECFRDMKAKAHAAWKSITAKEASYTDVLDAVERAVKSAVVKFDDEQERMRRAEQARLQAEADAEARRERERLEKEAAKLKTPEKKAERMEQAAMVVAPVVQVAAAPKVEGATTRKTWKARVTDLKLVPREYLIVNEAALNAFAKATKGAVPLPGVEFYEETSLAIGGR